MDINALTQKSKQYESALQAVLPLRNPQVITPVVDGIVKEGFPLVEEADGYRLSLLGKTILIEKSLYHTPAEETSTGMPNPGPLPELPKEEPAAVSPVESNDSPFAGLISFPEENEKADTISVNEIAPVPDDTPAPLFGFDTFSFDTVADKEKVEKVEPAVEKTITPGFSSTEEKKMETESASIDFNSLAFQFQADNQILEEVPVIEEPVQEEEEEEKVCVFGENVNTQFGRNLEDFSGFPLDDNATFSLQTTIHDSTQAVLNAKKKEQLQEIERKTQAGYYKEPPIAADFVPNKSIPIKECVFSNFDCILRNRETNHTEKVFFMVAPLQLDIHFPKVICFIYLRGQGYVATSLMDTTKNSAVIDVLGLKFFAKGEINNGKWEGFVQLYGETKNQYDLEFQRHITYGDIQNDYGHLRYHFDGYVNNPDMYSLGLVEIFPIDVTGTDYVILKHIEGFTDCKIASTGEEITIHTKDGLKRLEIYINRENRTISYDFKNAQEKQENEYAYE